MVEAGGQAGRTLAEDAANPRSLWRSWGLWIWLGVFLASATLYIATANRGIQWQDGGAQQLRIITGNIHRGLGLVLTHPLQYYLGRAVIRIPGIYPPFAITLISSVCGALAVANLALIIHLLTRRPAAALISAAAFLFSHTFWQHATHTETYCIVAALLSTEWLCLAGYARSGRGGFLLGVALANGLGVATHLLAGLATPVDAVVIILALKKGDMRWRQLAAAVLLWIAGTLPYSLLVLETMIRTGDITATLHSATMGDYSSQVLNTSLGLRTLMLAAAYVAYNFPGLTLPLAIYGLFSRRARSGNIFIARVLKAQLVIYLLFVVRYTIVDQYSFFFIVYALLAIFAGVGMATALEHLSKRVGRFLLIAATLTAVWTPLIYKATTHLLASRNALSSMVGNKPYRDGYRTFFIPWGIGQDHPSQVNKQAFKMAGDCGLVLVADSMARFGLQIAQNLGQAPPEVTVMTIEESASPDITTRRRKLLAECLDQDRPVVFVPRDRDKPKTCVEQARWERVGDLYRLTHLVEAEGD